MIKTNTLFRPGMTAIAAVFAMSSTSLVAQEAVPQPATPQAAPVQTAPVPVTPPLVVVPTVPTPVAPTAIVPAAPAPATAVPSAPIAPADVVEDAPAAAPVATPAPRAQPRQAAAPRAAATATTPATDAAPVEASVPAELAAAPVPAEAAPAAIADPVPVTAEASGGSDMLLLGGAGLAVLALGAAGFALTRRRSRDDAFDDDDALAYEAVVEPPMAEQPVIAPQPRPAPAFMPAAMHSDGLDDGRYVRAAHAGPSAENPFLSLTKRLKRARFLDKRAAQASESPTPQRSTAAPAFATAPSRYEERRFDQSKRSQPMRPAFQY